MSCSMYLDSIERLQQKATSHSHLQLQVDARKSFTRQNPSIQQHLPIRKSPTHSRVFTGHLFHVSVTVYAAHENPNTVRFPPKERE